MKVLKSDEMLCDHCVDRIKIGLMDAGIEAEVELSDKSIILPEDDDTLIEKAKEVLGGAGVFCTGNVKYPDDPGTVYRDVQFSGNRDTIIKYDIFKDMGETMKEERRNENSAVRINKFLSQAGVCSRRQADFYVEQGKVTVDGKTAEPGTKVCEGQEVCFNGKPIRMNTQTVYLAYNKPKGIVCTSSKEEANNIIDAVGYPSRIYPVGRLDKDSQGLILLTNDGEAANEIMKARNYHEKEYEVKVSKRITNDFIQGMRNGVPLSELDTVTRKCTVKKEGPENFRIILTQGLNRQIRRMCEYFGYRVTKLRRVRVMNIRLGNLKEGSYRKLTPEEIKKLKEELIRER